MLQPLSPGRDAAAPDSTRRGSGVPPGARTVLVVEDEPALRHFVRRALEGAGYAVVEAADGGAALHLVDAQAAALVLTDVLMPNHDGIEVALGLRARQAPIPIVVMTGGSAGLDVETLILSARAFGADAALAKPFTVAELLAVVRETPAGGARRATARGT